MPVAQDVNLDSPRVRQLSDGNSNGTVLGQSPSDLIGFYTSATSGAGAPVSQASGAAQAALVRGNQAGSIGTMATSQSPTGVNSQTSAEQGLTILPATANWQVGTNDLLFLNKPSSTANIVVGNVRVSAANAVAVTFSNMSSAVASPATGEKYGVVVIKGFPTITQALTPASVAANTAAEQQFSVTGLRVGELVQVMKPTAQAGLNVVGCRVAAANTLGITYLNNTATAIVPTSETYTIFSLGGLDALNNDVLVQASVGVIAGVTTQTVSEQSVTVTGLLTSDNVTGWTKPTAQAAMPVNVRVSAANTAAISYWNVSTAVVTPTASEVYGLRVHRANPVAPMVLYSAALAPSSVNSQTTSEQSFSVPGVIAGSAIWVNKPSATPGIGIAGVRVSAAGLVAINYVNATTGALTPPTETYLIGNFQQPIPDVNNSWIYAAVPAEQQMAILGNALRNAATNLGLIAGQ